MRAWLIRLLMVVALPALALDPPLARYAVTSPAGYRTSPIGGVASGETLHRGVDLYGPLGCDVLAAAPGVVVEMWPAPDGWYRGHPTFGGMVVVDHGSGVWTLYGHLRSVAVHEGERVARGQPIGRQGNTGRSDGEHTHFEVIVSPMLFFDKPLGLNDRLRMQLLK